MASFHKCIAVFPRTAIHSHIHRLVTPAVRTRACAATPSSSKVMSTATSSRVRSFTSIKSHAYSMSSKRQHTIMSGSARQLRLNSSAATAQDAADILSSGSSLKIHNMQYDESGKELTIDITDKAVKQLKHIAAREQNPLQALRITVDSGGCHGYQYLMDLTDTVNEDDVVFEKDGGRVIVDTITLPMISGSRIDFIEELIGSAFKVLANPHAAHSCGCDTSFEIKI
ncbi:hypothetical protein BC939DRAFT_458062 [Gamsiella multidivaricata]|uniref:uncharacterized protein n=1 Tax=Gamsiella multidivaricata TaxID=101098 RepID=UPI0022202834|nr:uncharacterized protein BC939DRAFT_458062 [Gamsiella multidivaricata]KAI7820235.1 hypothetical protein BC939DRAFT_458062 [Gamsiella multidivaricata]